MSKSGKVIAVVGPSGVGKDSVMCALAASDPNIMMARRVITRSTEAGGEDFEGVSEAEFEDRRLAGEFILSWQAHGLSYGVPKRIARDLAAGRTILANLSRSVLLDAQAAFPELHIVSLTASPEVLAERLSERGRETADEQARRLLRGSLALPVGLQNVNEIDNSGPLEVTVQAILASLQPESV